MNIIEGVTCGISKFIEIVNSSSSTDASTESWLDKIVSSTEKASQISYNIMDIIYILATMVIVVAIFTITLQVYKFFMNRRDPSYKKNDDTFLDD